MHFQRSIIAAIVLQIAAVSAFATPTIEGIVKDAAGKPVKGASVWIQSNDGKQFSKIVQTDEIGHYVSGHIAIGSYKVAVLVNGSAKSTIVNATTQHGKATEVNFALNERVRAGKTRMVWVPSDTGSHLGRWIEVDENGKPVNTVGAAPMDRAAGNALSLGVGR